MDYIYFPYRSMISVTAMTREGLSAEVGGIGCEGLIGMEALMGSERILHENTVQHADGAWRINVNDF